MLDEKVPSRSWVVGGFSHSTHIFVYRVIRQIVRGDFEHFQRQAEEGRKRQRMYLVATDLSPEAEYALEWTIGTVLRDGDTLFAVYAADEELVGTSGEGGVEIGAGADSARRAMRVDDNAAIVRGRTTRDPMLESGLIISRRDRSAKRKRAIQR